MSDWLKVKLRPMARENDDTPVSYLVKVYGRVNDLGLHREVACTDWDHVLAFLNSLTKIKGSESSW